MKELIEMKWAGLNHLCNVYIAILIELCILGDEYQKIVLITMGKKKRTLCFASFCSTMGLKHRKSMTILKLFKKSSKCDVAGHCSFIRLEMAMV